MSIMNYNSWFHKYHQYLTGDRNGVRTYNDTKWHTLNERYQNMIDTMSDLLRNQPYNVVGNEYGFQQLYDLLERSNYTFEDLNKSLMETYQMTLQNAMSDMLVNTHCVIANYKMTDKKHVHQDVIGNYYIVDVPFDQLHFGERDEFVRQKLHAFYETESKYFMPNDRFLSDEITKILGFSIVCCVNGFMSDDWFVGITEQGFRFKIGWKYSSDVTFTIFKLDESFVCETVVSVGDVRTSNFVSYEDFNIEPVWNGTNCIVQICDPILRRDILIAPNFGYFDEHGLRITNLQQKTVDDFAQYNSTTVKVRAYVIKYLREISGVYPAVNYFDMMGAKYVYNDKRDHIVNYEDHKIVLQDISVNGKLPICTPPISLTRQIDDAANHTQIRYCHKLKTEMLKLNQRVQSIGISANTKNPNNPYDFYNDNVLQSALFVCTSLKRFLQVYLNGAIITSLIPMDYVHKFESMVQQFETLSECDPTYQSIQSHTFETLYGENYRMFCDEICKPLDQPPFTTIGDIDFPDYFVKHTVDESVYRPVSEQCFLTLKFNPRSDLNCWVFDVPIIKHFSGIENVFYIDDNLVGDEVFKFLYLYTETRNPNETVVSLTDTQRIDFDEFSKEVNRHMGYIRYWDVTNRLYKLSQIYYRDDNISTELSLLSKVLKQKLDGDVFLTYATDVNYELSAITNDNTFDYTRNSIRAPFAINFLFYTLSKFYGNENRLQSYLMQQIVNKKFYPRYADLKLSDLHDDTLQYETINYSVISCTPLTIESDDESMSNVDGFGLYANIQMPLNGFTAIAPSNAEWYPYVFNTYASDYAYQLLENDGTVNSEYYIKFADVTTNMGQQPTTTYFDDPKLAQMVAVYLAEVYDGINQLVTNYTIEFNQTTAIDSLLKTIETHRNKIIGYVNDRGTSIQFQNATSYDIVNDFRSYDMETNPICVILNELKQQTRGALFVTTTSGGRVETIYNYTQSLLTMIRKIYEQTGFDRYAIRRARRAYIQLKQINQRMSLYQYKEWISNVDMDVLRQLPSYFSDNENLIYNKGMYGGAFRVFDSAIQHIPPHIDALESELDKLLNEIQTDYIQPLVEYCDTIIQNNIFDFYIMNRVKVSKTLASKPAYALIYIPTNDDHVAWNIVQPTAQNYALTCHVRIDDTSDVNTNILIPICENAFMDGTPLSVNISFMDDSGNVIDTANNVTVTFTKIGTSADMRNPMSRYIGMQTIPLDVQNVHETFDVDGDGNIINERHAEMHYELLCGNRFTPLSHFSEFCDPPIDSLQGPIDKLYLSCDQMNRLSSIDESNRPTKSMSFRPCEVFHIEPVDGVITSIGGKYFEGQTIYAVTDDGLSLIPMIITKIDHSLQHGFVEAKVDLYHAKWFTTTDDTIMHQYLTNDIVCNVVDDNIRNFMDEYTDYDGDFYPLPNLKISEDDTVTTLSGDPIFVNNNEDYVYTRLSWMFHDDVPNLDPTDENFVKHHFIYIGSGCIENDDHTMMVNMIQHDFNPYTLPELYPVLRTEPDDHSVWHKEIEVFKAQASIGVTHENESAARANYYQHMIAMVTTDEEKLKYTMLYEDAKLKQKYWKDYTNRMDSYIQQLETPSTWYNIRAYDDALVYIDNGRAHITHTFHSRKHDLIYSDQVEVMLYDWEHKEWIDPSKYGVESITEDGIQSDYADVMTDTVMTQLNITFSDTSFTSKRILIYFVYASSDVYDDIPLNDMQCTVRFQPVLNLDSYTDEYEPYATIRIRKHYDENETYRITTFDTIPDGFPSDAIAIARPNRSGTYTNGSPIRFCDLQVIDGGSSYDYTDFDVYIPNSFIHETVPVEQTSLGYDVNVLQPIENFVEGEHVTLLSVNTGDFHITASNIMFEGVTTDPGTIQILQSNIQSIDSDIQDFVCFVNRDKHHPMFGGVIVVTVTKSSSTDNVIPGWFQLNDNIEYRLIPNRFVIVPTGATFSNDVIVQLSNNYELDILHDVDPNNANPNDLFMYYYDKTRDVRYPIGDVRVNQYKKRFTVDRIDNPSISLIRSNYIGICRYVSQRIPEDGIIDLTGYIPTPLSRDRYEFWVNGRFVSNDDQIVILSPTTFQLRNMTSLKNLDVVELVDDIQDSVIMNHGPIYMDANGDIYTSFYEMLKHHGDTIEQRYEYTFNQDLRSSFDSYIIDANRHPNNHDFEHDIMDYVISSDVITSYNELCGVPTINGITLQHLTSYDLGLRQMPNQMILDTYDIIWKKEALNGIVPFKHIINQTTKKQTQSLHCIKHVDEQDNVTFEVYVTGLPNICFTLYISNTSTDTIDQRTNVQQIIPFIQSGVHVFLSGNMEGLYLHSTIPDTDSIQIK